MLYREIIAVCSQIHTKHINTVCGQNVELLHVKLGGKYSDHCDLKLVTNTYFSRCHKAMLLEAQIYCHENICQ